MRNRLISFITTLLLLLLLFTPKGFADDPNKVLKLEELKIQVMPEFAYHPKDKKEEEPTLLVGYHGTLMNTTDTPQKGQIEIPLPMDDTDFRIGFVADYNRDLTEMIEIEYEVEKKNGTITWETSEEILPGELYKFVIEYYTDAISANEEQKSFSYTYNNFADAGIVSIVFLEPLKSENFKLTPAADSHQQNPYGMNMFMFQYQGMKAKEEKHFEIDYTRAETQTTMDIINEMAGTSSQGEAATKVNETLPISTIILIVGGVTLLAGTGLILFLKKRKTGTSKKLITQSDKEDKKTRLRGMLLEGTITEQEYHELLKKMGV